MKRLLSTTALIVSFVIVPSIHGQFDKPDGPVCGTDQAMARMTKEKRGYMIASSTAFRATELMIYLNFDGAVIRSGFDNAGNFTSSIVSGVRNCPAPTLTQSQKDEVIKRVIDDYSPFNILVTTDINEFLAYPVGFREMVLVTTTPSVAGFSNGTGRSVLPGPGSLASAYQTAFRSYLLQLSATIRGMSRRPYPTSPVTSLDWITSIILPPRADSPGSTNPALAPDLWHSAR